MEEVWKKVREKRYHSFYKVSHHGRVKSVAGRPMPYRDGRMGTSKGKILKPWIAKRTGYLNVALSKIGKVKNFPVHRLVAKAFIPNPENKREVNHKDGNKLNNNVDNLEWATPKENGEHASFLDLIVKGEEKWNARLTNFKVRRLRRLRSKHYSYSKIGRILGVSAATVSQVVRGVTWKHVE